MPSDSSSPSTSSAPSVPVLTDDTPCLLWEREGMFAFYKPAGMNVHPSAESDAMDLLTWIQAQGIFPEGIALAHRLDRETSGLVLCGGDAETCATIGRWLKDRQVTKRYLALVYGVTHGKGIIRRKLVDQRRKRGLPALTRYRRREVLGGCSLLVMRPETGRKHQLRRHAQAMGHAVVGDRRYPPKRFRPVPGFPERLWLHASSVVLPDGTFVSCPLPPALEAHLEFLRGESASS